MHLARDYDALSLLEDREHDPYAKHFIQRAGARNKKLSVHFDPAKHKEWVTGFHKRRTERKTAARKNLEVRAKQERLDDRQQRFEKKKQDLNLPDDYGVGDIDEDEKKDKETLRGQKQYTDAGVRTVVTTSAIAMHSDDDEEEKETSDSDTENRHTPLGVLAARDTRQNDAAVPEAEAGHAAGHKRTPTGQQKRNRSAAVPSTGEKTGKRTSSAERLRKLSQAKESKKSRRSAPRAKRKGKGGGKGKGKSSR